MIVNDKNWLGYDVGSDALAKNGHMSTSYPVQYTGALHLILIH